MVEKNNSTKMGCSNTKSSEVVSSQIEVTSEKEEEDKKQSNEKPNLPPNTLKRDAPPARQLPGVDYNGFFQKEEKKEEEESSLWSKFGFSKRETPQKKPN